MMIPLVLALALLQVVSGQLDDEPVALQLMMDDARKAEGAGARNEAIRLYEAVREKATRAQSTDSVNQGQYARLISNAALHAATLLEPEFPDKDEDATRRTILNYEAARRAGTAEEQRALAGNNLATFYWRWGRRAEARKTMDEIRYEALAGAQRSYYLDNYGQLLELSSAWAEAAEQYRQALWTTPADENALAGIRRLLRKEWPERVVFALKVADFLIQGHHARNAVVAVLDTLENSPKLSDKERHGLMLSLLQGYALSATAAAEFETLDQDRFGKIQTTQPAVAPLLLELQRAFLGKFEVTAARGLECGGPDTSRSAPGQNAQQAVVPLVPALDRVLSGKFQSVEYKSAEKLFQHWIALDAGASPALSQLLESVADQSTWISSQKSAHRPDVNCAAHRYAAAWLLDSDNDSAALALATLYHAGRLPGSLKTLVSHDVAGSCKQARRLSILYRDPSHKRAWEPGAENATNRQRICELTGSKAPAKSGGPPDEFATSPLSKAVLGRVPRVGDTVVRGMAPHEAEAVYVETFRGHGQPHCGQSEAYQSAIVATNVLSGSFTVPLQNSLAKGEMVCVFPIQDGVRSATPTEQIVESVQFSHHVHNYVVGGAFMSEAAGAWKFWPRASWNIDFNLGRWGYDRYQDQSDRPYSRLTGLLNVYAEARTTFIPMATAAQPAGAGLAHVHSLEFGGYAPIFAHWTTWRFLNYQRAFFFSPLIKGGVDFLPHDGPHPALSTGVRLGILRLARSTTFTAPDLQSYVDVVYGNSTNVFLGPASSTTCPPTSITVCSTLTTATRVRQLDVTGMLKIPETPIYLGFNSTAGQGPKQIGVFVGVRIEFARLLRPAHMAAGN